MERNEEKKNIDQAGNNKEATKGKKLFIEPKLSKHGNATEVTGSFFGAFSGNQKV